MKKKAFVVAVTVAVVVAVVVAVAVFWVVREKAAFVLGNSRAGKKLS